MKLVCRQSRLAGSVEIPGSKSHTIRAVAACSLARGESTIHAPLVSADTLAAADAYEALGASIERGPDPWRVRGTGGELHPPAGEIDVRNSGTSLRLCVGSASLLRRGRARFTGDAQVRRRPLGPLIRSLNELGAHVESMRGDGRAPLTVQGMLRGGRTSIEAVTSQYLSSLLMSCPLAEHDSTIEVTLLNEAPYVLLTLHWLSRAGIEVRHESLEHFVVPGGQAYRPLDVRVPADFSSATFFLGAGAVGDNDITLVGLDPADPQGDKAVIDHLRRMGAEIEVHQDAIRVRGGDLAGCDLDLNATPDALPMMAVVGCFASGRTRLLHVPQARLKETDRISVMCGELGKMGAAIRELEDGLVIEQSDLGPADLQGHGDHRVVMALAVAGSLVPGETRISTAEAVGVTFPTFVECMAGLGARLELLED